MLIVLLTLFPWYPKIYSNILTLHQYIVTDELFQVVKMEHNDQLYENLSFDFSSMLLFISIRLHY